ncbi:MAG: hypothetical protein C5B52_05060 [Bacteroidetes bacterium]|nr:MAG: hypothetical protein C5B52_05060 [Bacteroidota bacterium]
MLWVDTSLEFSGAKTFSVRNICKGYSFVYPLLLPIISLKRQPLSPGTPSENHVRLLQVSGNIMYDVNYRSRVDTPFTENNIYQHTLQTRLNFLYKEKYPFRLFLTTHFSNSPWLRKYTDLNFQYIQSDFARIVKKRVSEAVEHYLRNQLGEMDSLRQLIAQYQNAIASLKQFTEGPGLIQRQVEERERKLYSSQRPQNQPTVLNTDILQNDWMTVGENKLKKDLNYAVQPDSLKKNANNPIRKITSAKDTLESTEKKIDSLLISLEHAEKLLKNAESFEHGKLNTWKSDLDQVKDPKALSQRLQELHVPDSVLPKGYKTLYSIQSFSIGRSIANYSELSVKNVSITGLQAEYNPGFYYAVALGKVDYRFRDYLAPSYSSPHQYVALVRVGKGMKNGNHLYFSYYTGKRQFYNSAVAVQPNLQIPEYHIAGIAIEGQYRLTKNTFVAGEIAKSTIPYYSLDSLHTKNWFSSFARFGDHSNEAYSIRLTSYLPKTHTRFDGNFRYLGANFQSYSTFTTGAAQMKWMGRVEQPFFKRKLTIIASVQQNDYDNPFATATYKSSSVLASIQAMLRLKKWPSLSLGYYPSYQLTKVGADSYSETRYYTLIGNLSHHYQLFKIQFSTYFVYSQFYNQASDSGFAYFNSRNFLVSQTAFVRNMSFTLNGSVSDNADYRIVTIENNDQFTINKFLSIGGGIKHITNSFYHNIQWGYSGNLSFRFPKLGEIQFMMDKGFLPGYNRQLVDSKVGRLTYFKTF